MIAIKNVNELMNIKKPVDVGINCTVIKCQSFKSKKGKLITKMKVLDDNFDTMILMWYNNPTIVKRYITGSILIVYGRLIPAVYDRNGLKNAVSMWCKTIKPIVIVSGGF